MFFLTAYDHCLVLFTQDGVQNGCQIIMSDRMFQPFNYVVVKTGNFYNSLVEKAIKTFMLPKTTIREVQNTPMQK